MIAHGLVIKDGLALDAYKRLGAVRLNFVGECYLCVREGATQGRGAGGGEAHSPPLLLQRPGQLFKLHLLLPDRLQQSRCALTLLHTHYTAPRGERGALHTSIQLQTHYTTVTRCLTKTDTSLHTKYSKSQMMQGTCVWWISEKVSRHI